MAGRTAWDRRRHYRCACSRTPTRTGRRHVPVSSRGRSDRVPLAGAPCSPGRAQRSRSCRWPARWSGTACWDTAYPGWWATAGGRVSGTARRQLVRPVRVVRRAVVVEVAVLEYPRETAGDEIRGAAAGVALGEAWCVGRLGVRAAVGQVGSLVWAV